MMALPLVPYTIMKLCRAATKKAKSINCQCAVCSRSGNIANQYLKRQSSFLSYLVVISNFSTWSNLTLVLLWIVMGVLVYYIKSINRDIQVFEPFSILGLQPGATDSEIRRHIGDFQFNTIQIKIQIQFIYRSLFCFNPDAHKYFVESIAKAYQALTDQSPVKTLKVWSSRWSAGTFLKTGWVGPRLEFFTTVYLFFKSLIAIIC
ncbi:putative DnaJ domain-containing protein [Helianthus annuus]|nr:putative DnaJ domain-containing protein [Helianthus annuus]